MSKTEVLNKDNLSKKDFCPHDKDKRGLTKILVFKQRHGEPNFIIGENEGGEGRVDEFLPENACVIDVEVLNSTPSGWLQDCITIYALYYHEA